MSQNTKTSRLRRIILYAGLFVVLAVAANHIPGHYTLDTVRESFDRDSAEGVGLEGVESNAFRAVLYFGEAAVQQINRNVRLQIRAGSTLRLSARAVTCVDEEEEEVVAVFQDVRLVSDQPITFLYRNLPIAITQELESIPGDAEHRIRAHGRYRLSSALLHLPHYRRARGPKRVWQAPTRAEVTFSAQLKPEHTFTFEGIGRFETSARPSVFLIEDAVFEKGEWLDGHLALNLHFGDTLQYGKVTLSDVKDGAATLRADLAHRGRAGPRLAAHGGVSLSSATLDYEDGRASANLFQVRAQPEAKLTLLEDRRIHREGATATLEGRAEDVLIDNVRNRVTIPLVDLRTPSFSVRLDDDEPVLHLVMGEPLDVQELDWTRTRDRETLSVEDGGLRLEPFTFRLSSEEGGSGTNLQGTLRAASVRLARADDQWVLVDDAPQLKLSAGSVQFHDGEILVRDGRVEGVAGSMSTMQRDFKAGLHDAVVWVRADRKEPDIYRFEGEARAAAGAEIIISNRAEIPALSLAVVTKPVAFRGDQDHIRITLPELTLSISQEDLERLLNEALEQNRDRIWEETRRRGRLILDLRSVDSVEVRENNAEVVIGGRIRMMGPRIFGERIRMTRSFTAAFIAEFELPAEGLLHEAELGVRVESVKDFSFRALPDPINRYLPDLIAYLHKGPLLHETRPLSDMVRDVPEGIHINHVRFYGREGDLALEVSGEVEFR